MNDVTPTPEKNRSPATFRDFSTEPFGWLRSEIDRLFDDFPRPARSIFNFAPRGAAPVPALELIDDDKAYHLTVELPGLTEQDVDVSFADGLLSISGEKREEQEHKEKGVIVSERRYGSFQRQVGIPGDVDPDGIRARFKDGVLTVTLTKDEKAAARTRKIAIEKA